MHCHISYPTINYAPNINNNNINNFIINPPPAMLDGGEDSQQFSQLSGLSYVKSGKQTVSMVMGGGRPKTDEEQKQQ